MPNIKTIVITIVANIMQHLNISKSFWKILLLVTTHYDMLLNSLGDDLIRNDSVRFTDKMESGSTDLYSLVEYKGLNSTSSFLKAYRNGVGCLKINN